MPKRRLAYLLLLSTVLVWGATFTLVKSALADASPLLFNLMRMALATVALALVNHRHLRSVSREQMQAGLLAGVFLAVGYQLQTLGLTHTSPAKSAFITGLVVVFVPAFTLVPAFRPAGSARPGINAALGAMLAFAGLFLITTRAGTRLGNLATSIGPGDLLTLLCAVAFAAHMITLARYSKGVAAGLLATLQIGFATLTMLFTLPFEHTHALFTPRLLMTLAVCSLLATAAAFTIQSFAQQVLPPTHTVVLLTLEPVFAWLTSLLVLHEALGRRALIGAGLILAGIAVIELLPAANATEIPA
jgi:drug/metabolite transporter (DMT)-like permease